MNRSRVLIADDHRIVAEGLRGILEPTYELVGIVEKVDPAVAVMVPQQEAVAEKGKEKVALCVRVRAGCAAGAEASKRIVPVFES